MIMSLFVIGGSGLLGRAICRKGIENGFIVKSLARSPVAHNSASQNEWSSKVEWIQGDIFDPDSWRLHLQSATSVVHSLGMLMENDYKRWLGKTETPRKGSETLERINRDSAVLALQEAELAGIKSFVFISAGAALPFLNQYVNTKHQAERVILKSKLRSIVLRPNFIYSDDAVTQGIAAGMQAAKLILSPLKSIIPAVTLNTVDCSMADPLSAEMVAEAVLKGVIDEKVNGIYTVDGIRSLAFSPRGFAI